MASKQKVQAGIKVKKKIWVPIIAPRMFNEIVVGETPAESAQATVGKMITVNLMTLTGDARKQSVNTKLKIIEIKEGKAATKLMRYEVNPPAIKRLVRRNKERIETTNNTDMRHGIIFFMRVPFSDKRDSVWKNLKSILRNLILL